MLATKTRLIHCFTVFLLFFGSIAHAEVVDIDNEALQALLDQGIPIVDIRRVDEWQDTGVIDKSHLLTFFDKRGNYSSEKWLKSLDSIVKSDEPVIIICRSGNRSEKVSQWLSEQQGYARVYNVTDGIIDWKDKGGKTVTPE
ncbi:rhodanese-like domain-containing protein [Granulosicoccus antarcticus]|uniref:Thiosulfate sulfurtransferase GlpE n=1 Tax=Granulosicoccus antarcticus IMCC3135 TaxID=1192854 RepID=A0A2Z2NUX8_9GAMM|nr:rhodanese-like domain-containing protein [Granulosicoccus antarcticus]ASJ75276.1 Thiosulfate sulfurtransferase GlpE [Granulosicoccus antarcticus IMCC3135]